jgi:Glycosyltransferases involved in cell wall biogenesis
MNMGLDYAVGEYVSFVESDDYVAPDMYEALYLAAKKNDLEIIKGNYCEISGDNPPVVTPKYLTDKSHYNKIFCPLDQPWSFYIPMMNPLGLFKNSFLTYHHVRHNETPGASHQDMGFWFQTFCLATRVMLVEGHYYMYRQDNPNSSINQKNKVFAVSDEYQFMFRFLQRHPELKEKALPIYYHRLYGSYTYRYGKLAPEFHRMFLERFSKEMNQAAARGDLDTSRFNDRDKANLKAIMEDSEAYWRSIEDPAIIAIDRSEKDLTKQQLAFYQRQIDRMAKTITKNGDITEEVPDLISVIIPVYNTAPYLPACLDTIVNQTYHNIEIICINDGSTDNSLEILNRYAEYDKRFLIFSQPNSGQGSARNLGLQLAKGKYVYYMDSDDLLAVDALADLYHEAEKDSLDILYFDGESFFDNAQIAEQHKSYLTYYRREREYSEVLTGSELFVRFKQDNGYRVSPCLQFIRRRFLFEHGISFPGGIIYEDNVFALKCILEAERASHRQKCFFTRRVREGSTMTIRVQFKNFYGYFVCYLEMQAYLCGKDFPPEVCKPIIHETTLILNNAINIYEKLSEAEKTKTKQMPPLQYEFFRRFIQSSLFPLMPPAQQSMKSYDAERELQLVKASVSFRIGHAITWFPRKIRGGVRCLKEHGFRYTFKQGLRHLHIIK